MKQSRPAKCGGAAHTLRALIGLCFVSTLAGGCLAPTPLDQKQVVKAQTDFRNKNYSAAQQKLDGFLSRFPKHPDSADAYYLRALRKIETSNKDQAREDARKCVELAKDRELKANAHATLATLLYENNNTIEAIDHFDAALKSLPDKPPADLLHYRYGICLQREGRWQDARLEFAAVYQRYPSSTLADHARRLYEWPHNAFSIQVGAFRDSDSASELNQRLKRSALPSRVERKSRSGETLYTVYVGKYPEMDDANRMLMTVKKVVSDAFVVPN